MIVDAACLSEKGLARKKNQDAIYMESNGITGIFVIADGMGGHSRGEFASTAVVQDIAQWWKDLKKDIETSKISEVSNQCKNVLQRTNRRLYEDFSGKNEIGGSTAAVLVIWGNDYFIISIGDSHIYHKVHNKMVLMTFDDVWENLPEVRNIFSEKEILKSDKSGKLTAAAGVREKADFHVQTGELFDKELFLLCSDGVYKYCSEKEINQKMCRFSILKTTKKMIKMLEKCVVAQGAGDNYSVIICKVTRK